MKIKNIYTFLLKKIIITLKVIFPLPDREKSTIVNLRSLVEQLFSIFILSYCFLFIYTPYSSNISACESEYFFEKKVPFKCEDVNVKIIDNLFVFSIINLSFNVDTLGVNSFLNTIFINKASIIKSNQNINDIIKHELEHTNQRMKLGLIGFYMTPKWIIEGSADYVRGKPTIEYCQGFTSWGDDSNKQFYFESWAKVFYLLKYKGLNFEDLYKNNVILDVNDDVIKTKLADIFCPLEK